MPDVLEEFAAALRQTHPEVLDEHRDDERLTDSRRAWQPVYGHLFSIRPWEMGLLTLREIRLMSEYVAGVDG